MTKVEKQLNDRFKVIISHCQDARNEYQDAYEVKYKRWIDFYSKEIIEKKLIEKGGEEQYFAKQLCMVNGLTWYEKNEKESRKLK